MTPTPPTHEPYAAVRRSRDRWRAWCALGWLLFVTTLALFTLARTASASAQSPETRAAANADRQRFDVSQWGHLFYLTTDNLAPARVTTAGRTAAFVTSSFSRAVVLEHHLPVEVARGLYRIDLRGLKWARSDWDRVLLKYPYAPESRPLPLIVRADWLVVALTDNFESRAGYDLLYGGKNVPATITDFRAFWRVGKGREELALFHVQDESGVNVAQIRWIENEDTPDRGYYWGTQDNAARNENAATDPLETLRDRNRKHDASEHIIGFLKTSIAQGIGGTAQGYLLANGAGKRQDRAPVDIVRDSTKFRGLDEIRNSGSCIQCHVEGIRPLPQSSLRARIAAGTALYADKKSQELIEQQYLAETRLRIEQVRAQEDYTAFVLLATGWGPEENARAFRQLVDDYDAPVTLEVAARELYLSPEELRLAFGYASAKQIKLGARLAGLVDGQTISRPYWESQFTVAWSAAQIWKKVGK